MKHQTPALTLAMALCCTASLAAPESYTIDPLHTFPSFEVRHFGFSTQRGRFNKTSGTILFDLEKQTGKIELEIDAASIDMGAEIWNETMRSEDFFNTRAYPIITYRSEKLLFSGNEIVGAEGTMTLLAVSRPVPLKVTSFKCGADLSVMKRKCGADVVAEIKRSDFGMTKYLPFVGDTIRLLIPVEAFRD